MKNFTISLIIAVFVSLFLAVCNNDHAAQQENHYRLLSQQTQQQDSVIQEFMVFFNAFEANIKLIMEKENLLSLHQLDQELVPNQKEKILTDLQIINDLLDQNQGLIDKLQTEIVGNQTQLGRFQQLVDRLQTELSTRIDENDLIRRMLVDMNDQRLRQDLRMDTLQLINDRLLSLSRSQAELIADQETDIHFQQDTIRHQQAKLKKGYYIVGTEKELLNKDIIRKSGSLFARASKYRLNPDLKTDDFTSINTHEFEGMWVVGKKVQLASAHPSESYLFHELNEDNMRSLQITDPNRFWSMSKYLVVVFP